MRTFALLLALSLSSAAMAQPPPPASMLVPVPVDSCKGGKPLAAAEWFAPGAFAPGQTVSAGGLDFVLGTNLLDVSISMSGIKEIVRVKGYLDGKSANNSNRCVMSIPGSQYSALYLLAFSRKTADAVPRMTVRIGVFGGMTGVLHDEVVQVPDIMDKSPSVPNVLAQVPVKLAAGGQGSLFVIRVPLDGAGNVREGLRDLEFTRDIRPRVNLPDPNEFGEMPLGHPSGVVVLGALLEKSPVMMTHDSSEAGNVFNEPVKPAFTVTLSNRTERTLETLVTADCEGPGTAEEGLASRGAWSVSRKATLKPGEEQKVVLDVQPASGLRGWFSCRLAVKENGVALQRRDTTFAVLAPDTRKAFDESPFGIWEFWRPHSAFYRPDQPAKLASLMKKGGWRWTYGGNPGGLAEEGEGGPELYKRLFKEYGFRMTIQSLSHSYQRGEGWFDAALFASNDAPAVLGQKEKGFDNAIKVMHESRSSTTILRRFSEFFGGAEYAMPVEEKAKLDKQFENVKQYCAAIKKVNPEAKIVLINDYPHVAIEFMKRGFPADLFDIFGLECAGFMREPERQPDWLSLLGHAEMMKRAYKKYGYDKPMWTTEALYHATNPGNLSLHGQGVIAVREHMLALAIGFTKLAAAGIIKDPSDDYHWSNWGASGYCYRDPEINPKPSFAMIAWLTQILDQAVPSQIMETGSHSMYVLDFKKPDNSHVYPAWVVRGAQKAVFQIASGKPVVRDIYGNALKADFAGGKLTVLVSDTPVYITEAEVTGVASREPVELAVKTGALIMDFADPAQLKPVATTNGVLERNWDFPRIKGDFETAFETVDGATALKVALKPDADGRKLFQRYVEFALAKPIVLEGRPEQFNLRLKGNGGWSRIMFELVDAKGRIWTSCGNQYAGSCNASDNRGDSFVSFDGWQTMRIPLVHQYEGDDQKVMNIATPDWWPENAPEKGEGEAKYQAALAKYAEAVKDLPARQAEHAEAMKAYQEKKKTLPKKELRGLKAPPAPTEPVKPGYRWMGIAGVDYPVKLTKVIVGMPPNILYGNGERPVANPVLWLDKLSY